MDGWIYLRTLLLLEHLAVLTKVLLPYHIDFCSKLGLQSKLSEPPNGGNYGQNCFADPGKIHSLAKTRKLPKKEEDTLLKRSNALLVKVVNRVLKCTKSGKN